MKFSAVALVLAGCVSATWNQHKNTMEGKFHGIPEGPESILRGHHNHLWKFNTDGRDSANIFMKLVDAGIQDANAWNFAHGTKVCKIHDDGDSSPEFFQTYGENHFKYSGTGEHLLTGWAPNKWENRQITGCFARTNGTSYTKSLSYQCADTVMIVQAQDEVGSDPHVFFFDAETLEPKRNLGDFRHVEMGRSVPSPSFGCEDNKHLTVEQRKEKMDMVLKKIAENKETKDMDKVQLMELELKKRWNLRAQCKGAQEVALYVRFNENKKGFPVLETRIHAPWTLAKEMTKGGICQDIDATSFMSGDKDCKNVAYPNLVDKSDSMQFEYSHCGPASWDAATSELGRNVISAIAMKYSDNDDVPIQSC